MLQICAEFITSHLLMRRNKYLHQPKVFDVLKYSSSQLRKDSKAFWLESRGNPNSPTLGGSRQWDHTNFPVAAAPDPGESSPFLWLCAKLQHESQKQELPHLVL